MQTKDSFLPTRAIGLAYANIDPAQKALEVELLSLEQTKPRQPLEVAVKVGNVTPGETAYVTLAAVDAGILNLTGFEPPAPKEHYFGKRKLGVELRDVYGRLIDASKGNLGRIRSGGDAGSAAGLEGHLPPTNWSHFFKALSQSAPTDLRPSRSISPSSTAHCASWPSHGRGQASAPPIKTLSSETLWS